MSAPVPGHDLLEVRISAPAEHAQRLARLLVEERLAACAQVLPNMTSTFRWDGQVATELEQLILAKTHRSRFAAILERVGAEHPYDVPEILAVPIVDVSESYAAWLATEVGAATDPTDPTDTRDTTGRGDT
ncbi:divalent cation tolerance protein [Knoellia remsis]|uniref:Divalent cation tolerance protein n=1 Tax=Knoellia remsis TaxID=407159 RepID=A0A2T0U4M7_9MICO|nr:divalent-cation tolerance protein CutA [Knoellia remsis]PRY52885.1 divalent cation tolerance protein [Knoellia remsis]